MYAARKPSHLYQSQYIMRKRSTRAAFQESYLPVEQNETKSPSLIGKILDYTPKGKRSRHFQKYAEALNAVKTVEEKMIALNLPRYWGWLPHIVKEGETCYNHLPFAQHVTKTTFYEMEDLNIQTGGMDVKDFTNKLKPRLENMLAFELEGKQFAHDLDGVSELTEAELKDVKATSLVRQLHRVVLSELVRHRPAVLETQTDISPRIEAFWRVGGFYPSPSDIKRREEKKLCVGWSRIDKLFQYFGKPILQYRGKLPLEPFPECTSHRDLTAFADKGNAKDESDMEVVEKENTNFKVYPWQEYPYNPEIFVGKKKERMHGILIPGFWPNDRHRFGMLSYHKRGYLCDRPSSYGLEDDVETIHSQAILASYAWLLAQAAYQGFSTFSEITYPFVTQAVVTDGKVFSFYKYQLNTTLMYMDHFCPRVHPVRNECHGTLPQELYHDFKDGKVVGWNDVALNNLLSMYLNEPKERLDVGDMRPYVDKEESVIARVFDDVKREWLERRYKWLTAHRPRHFERPEIFDWERIYKVEFQTRPMDARKRFFEKFEDPLVDKKLSDHLGDYVPRAFRSHKKASRLPNFYPDAFPEFKDIE